MDKEHDLGDCEKLEGFLCEECRIWYMELELEWQEAETYREEYDA